MKLNKLIKNLKLNDEALYIIDLYQKYKNEYLTDLNNKDKKQKYELIKFKANCRLYNLGIKNFKLD